MGSLENGRYKACYKLREGGKEKPCNSLLAIQVCFNRWTAISATGGRECIEVCLGGMVRCVQRETCCFIVDNTLLPYEDFMQLRGRNWSVHISICHCHSWLRCGVVFPQMVGVCVGRRGRQRAVFPSCRLIAFTFCFQEPDVSQLASEIDAYNRSLISYLSGPLVFRPLVVIEASTVLLYKTVFQDGIKNLAIALKKIPEIRKSSIMYKKVLLVFPWHYFITKFNCYMNMRSSKMLCGGSTADVFFKRVYRWSNIHYIDFLQALGLVGCVPFTTRAFHGLRGGVSMFFF